MDRITVPEDQVVPRENVAAGVRGLRIAFVNVLAVTHADGTWTLIDAALPFTAGLIRRWAEKFATIPPNAIVLTQGHFDHAGAARELADEWNVPIYAHALEAPYLTGQKEYPPPNAKAGGGSASPITGCRFL
jgi:glyoxylase-like metal-dependent hydrolase (beta-lactamase superfamily II)